MGVYLTSYSVPGKEECREFLEYRVPKEQSYRVKLNIWDDNERYPFDFFEKTKKFTFDNLTIFYGNNGCGKSTILNLIASSLKLQRRSDVNTSPFFNLFCDNLCKVSTHSDFDDIGRQAEIITSDDVFKHILLLRERNKTITKERDSAIDYIFEFKAAHSRGDYVPPHQANSIDECIELGDRSKYANESMIFLTECNSAASSIVHSRDPEYQAVFALRGKPLNSYGMRLEATYANDELFYVVRTLGIEEDVDGLKYAKIVIATDADVDGLHIRNLLLTFFLQYFMPLVLSGHLYIFETPLFRVRNTKTTFYCYSEQERDEKAKELGGNVEITRFKGLGEISPDEFKQFVGPDIHLGQVVVENPKDIHGILRRCMGGNDKDRWKHIQDNLI